METLGYIVIALVLIEGGFAGGFFYCYNISEAYCQRFKKDHDQLKKINDDNQVYIKALEDSQGRLLKQIEDREEDINVHLDRIGKILPQVNQYNEHFKEQIHKYIRG